MRNGFDCWRNVMRVYKGPKIWEENKKRVVEGEKGRREKRRMGKGKRKMEQGERDRNIITFI